MTVLVTLDTETGIVRRWQGGLNTHVAGLVNDPEDGAKTAAVIADFAAFPHDKFKVEPPKLRTYEDAVREQRERT